MWWRARPWPPCPTCQPFFRWAGRQVAPAPREAPGRLPCPGWRPCPEPWCLLVPALRPRLAPPAPALLALELHARPVLPAAAEAAQAVCLAAACGGLGARLWRVQTAGGGARVAALNAASAAAGRCSRRTRRRRRQLRHAACAAAHGVRAGAFGQGGRGGGRGGGGGGRGLCSAAAATTQGTATSRHGRHQPAEPCRSAAAARGARAGGGRRWLGVAHPAGAVCAFLGGLVCWAERHVPQAARSQGARCCCVLVLCQGSGGACYLL